MYAYEWNHYLGSANTDGDAARLIMFSAPLHITYSVAEQRLDLGIYNRGRTPIEDVFIRLVTPDEIEVRPDGRWSRQFTHTYRYDFGEIDSLVGYHADGALFLKFPKPDTYRIEYAAKARGFDWVRGDLTIVVEPAP